MKVPRGLLRLVIASNSVRSIRKAQILVPFFIIPFLEVTARFDVARGCLLKERALSFCCRTLRRLGQNNATRIEG